MKPFDSIPRTAAEHFGLHLQAAVLVLRRALPPAGETPGVLSFLPEYYGALDRAGFRPGHDDLGGYWTALAAWERGAELPLARLADRAGLDPAAMTLLFTIGLAEEDGRFGLVTEAAGARDRRPTLGLISSWWRRSAAPGAGSARLRRLGELGLVEVGNPDAPRGEWSLRVAPAVWEALRGERPARPSGWAGYSPPGAFAPLDALVLPPALAQRAAAIAALVPASEDGPLALILRGPPSSGRRTLAGAIARSLGRGVLELDAPARLAGLAGPLATLLDAVPLLELAPGPGESITVPRLDGYTGPVALLLGRHGTLDGEGAEAPILLELGIPDAGERAEHWQRALGHPTPVASEWRLTAGAIRRAGRIAASEAALAGRAAVETDDLRSALRVLQGQALDRLATRVEARGDWCDLAAGTDTCRELELLELRCRHREALSGPGVRALFSGPSGTGKTLSARLLASVLGRDLYVVDLATVVDKYLGETEKNLDAVLSRAEELDVVLLLDEGDALLGTRTDVRSAHDRYANLETNFLLHRLEAFEGIVVVTTNAGERVDPAFRRRIDVVVEFRAPDQGERWSLWQLELPAGHRVDPGFLEEVSARCALTGGQIRNAVMHASLLALEGGRELDAGAVEVAVRREYRKSGGACPLRPRVAAHA